MKPLLLLIIFLLSLLLSQNIAAQAILKLKNGDVLQVNVQQITPQEIKYNRVDNLNGPLIIILKSTAHSLQYENGTTEKFVDNIPPVGFNTIVNPDVSTQPIGFGVGDIVETDYLNDLYRGIITEANQTSYKAVVELSRNGKIKKVTRQFYELTLIERANPVASPGYLATNRDDLPDQSTNQRKADLFFQGQTDANRYYQGYHGAGTGTLLTALLTGPIFGLIPAAACSSTVPNQYHLGIPNPELARNRNYYTGYTQQAHRIKNRRVWGNYGLGVGLAVAVVVALTSSYR